MRVHSFITQYAKPVYEQETITTVLWNWAVHKDREVTAKRPDIIIKNKRENNNNHRCDNTHRQKCHAKGREKEAKIQEFMYKDTRNIEPEMSDYTSNNWRHQNINKRFKEKFGSHTRKTFHRFTTKDRNTLNITYYTQSTTVWNLKPGWWGSLLVQEKYQEEKACDMRPQQKDTRQDWWNIDIAQSEDR